MKDRILIDGEWYIRENVIENSKQIYSDPIHYEGLVFEFDDYCFDVSRIYRDDGTTYDALTIEFTDKRPLREDWIVVHWDSMYWFKSLLAKSPEALSTLREMVCERGEREFLHILDVLVERGWLTIEL